MTTSNHHSQVPRHLGIIPDGNRRWAKAAGLPSFEGHRQGLEVAKKMCLAALDEGVEYFTMYAFSSENWQRAKDEVGYLMDLFLKLVINDLHELEERGVRFRLIGSRRRLSKKLLAAMDAAEERTKDNQAGTLALCLDYGGEEELVDATRSIVAAGVKPEEVTAEVVASYLYAPDIPPLDLIIRTSGEQRTSGFMLWRAAYAEFYFAEKFWPDFTTDDLKLALADYANRQRRFGQ